MYKRGRNQAMSDMYCVKCGGHMTVPRPRRKAREKSHLKDMYCPYLSFSKLIDAPFFRLNAAF